jgi:Uma2 family endonuclease
MSVLPDMGLPNTMSEVEYDALPEGVARRIEVVHGSVIVCESPTPQHQQVARRLANTFEAARPKEPCTRVQMETDVVLWHVPKYTFRRPDVVVYRCKEDRNAKPESADVLLMVEVSSPSTEREDLVDKMAQYAAAGIPAYLVVRMSADGDIVDAREFHLDAATYQYRVETLMEHGVVLTYPFKVAVPFEDLVELYAVITGIRTTLPRDLPAAVRLRFLRRWPVRLTASSRATRVPTVSAPGRP